MVGLTLYPGWLGWTSTMLVGIKTLDVCECAERIEAFPMISNQIPLL